MVHRRVAGACGGRRGQSRSRFTSCLRSKRLLGHLAPERMILSLVVLLAITGIVMNVLGPKILGMATDVIFTGVLGKNLPRGATKEQVVAELRAQGNNTFADMVERLNVIPGQGIDFTLLGSCCWWRSVCICWRRCSCGAGLPAERRSAALHLCDA